MARAAFWKSKAGIVLLMLAVIAIFYGVREHYGHVSQALPYLILLLCPLMHLFGHGHDGTGHGHDSANNTREEHRN